MTNSNFEITKRPDFSTQKREIIKAWRDAVVETLQKAESSPPSGASQGTWNLQSVIASVTPVYKTSDGNYAFEVQHQFATYLEFGTSPHEIEINSAEVLSDGEKVFGKKVEHPGTPALRFMQRGREVTIREYS